MMRHNKSLFGVVALATVVALAACTAPSSEVDSAHSVPASSINVTVAPLAPALRITDPAGRELTLPKPPERIVCLTGLCDDALTELGIKPAGTANLPLLTLPQLLGNNGKTVAAIPGSFGQEDVEAIGSLNPDLVIGLTGVHDGLAEALRKVNAPLWTVNPKTWEESIGYLRNLGSLTGRVEPAMSAERTFRNKLHAAVQTSRDKGFQRHTGLVMFGSADAIGVETADSLTGNLLSQLFRYPFPAKGTDVATASSYSVEEILARQPTVIFMYSLIFSTQDKKLSEQLAVNPLWKQVKAVHNGQVHEVHPKLWGAGRGTRSLGAIIDQVMTVMPSVPAE